MPIELNYMSTLERPLSLHKKRKVKINMNNYVENVIDDFPVKISNSDTDLTPSGSNLFEKGNSKRMGKKEPEYFHNSVAMGQVKVL